VEGKDLNVRAALPIRYERKVLAEQVRLLYAQSIPGFVATLISSTALVVVLWPQVPHDLLLAWISAMAVVTGVRLALVLAYRRATDRVDRAERWLRRFAAGVVVTGALWGVAGTVLFPAHSHVHQMFLLIVLAGMAAGAVPFLSSVFRVYAAYVLPMLAPLAVDLWLQPGAVFRYIAAMVLLYLLLLLISARRIAANLGESTDLRFERTALAEELEQANARLWAEAEQRRQAEQEAQESYGFLQRIMDSASDAIVVLSADGRLQRANPAMARLSGRSLEALPGTEFASLFGGDSRALLEGLLGGTKPLAQPRTVDDLELERPDGTRRTLSLSLAPVQGESGEEAPVLVGVAKDVTEQRNVERLKDEFVATVSHELRTPLTSIRGALGLIGRTCDESAAPETRALLEIADRNSERLLRLIDDLLDLQGLESAPARFRIAEHRIAELVEHAVVVNQAYAQHHEVRLEIQGPLSGAVVRVDRDRIVQVLTNLLSNAARFSPSGAQVTVGTEERDGWLRVWVRDQGPGIPEAFRSRIFERFAQAEAPAGRAQGGTGLGLSISKAVVEAMGGNIGFDSEPGKGSTFFVELPRSDGSEPPP